MTRATRAFSFALAIAIARLRAVGLSAFFATIFLAAAFFAATCLALACFAFATDAVALGVGLATASPPTLAVSASATAIATILTTRWKLAPARHARRTPTIAPSPRG